MTSITDTYADPRLRLECSPDEKTLVAAFPSGRERDIVTATTNPLTGGITLSGAGEQDLLAAMGVASTASVVTYNAAGQVETCTLGEKTWTVAYDSAGKATSQTDGTVIRTFNYDASGRYTGYSEA